MLGSAAPPPETLLVIYHANHLRSNVTAKIIIDFFSLHRFGILAKNGGISNRPFFGAKKFYDHSPM